MAQRSLQPLPSNGDLARLLDPRVLEIARAARDAGGRAVLVGGFVRDLHLGIQSKDIDVEVFGLQTDDLADLLRAVGPVKEVGRAFGVLRAGDLDVDFSLPRSETKVAAGHRGFDVTVDPELSYEEAARRRDLTINALSLDPLTGELLDPLNGLDDLRGGVLRACDAETFGDDPLRAIRVAQFAARLEMQPDPQLLWICHQQDLSELSPERIFVEMRKLLLRGVEPSIGLEILERTTLLRFFPELQALVGVPQDPIWHPEGDVWVHTLMVVDEAARQRLSGHLTDTTASSAEVRAEDEALMFAALCHDLGKAKTTFVEDGRIRSPGHDVAGEPKVESLLGRMRAPKDLIQRVKALTRHHLAPALLYGQNSTDRAYRRLARRLAHSGVSMQLLGRVARADHFGRTTDEALARRFPAGDHFIERSRALEVEARGPRDAVQGRHLIANGISPGPEFGRILHLCRELQDDTGMTDPEKILETVLQNEALQPRPSASD